MITSRVLPRSLRARLTIASVVVVAVVLGIAGTLTVVVHRLQLIDRVDDSLDSESAQVLSDIVQNPGRTEAIVTRAGDDRFVQLVSADGSVRAASASRLRAEPVIPVDARRVVRITLDEIPLEDDRYRVLVRRVDPGDGGGWIIVGENTDDVRDSMVALIRTFAILLPLATLLLGGVAWIMVGRTLRPVAAIRRRVGEISLNRLDERVPVPPSQDEIADLARTMNAMLDRLDQANERQQRFVADASHELRSPLTRLRTSLEVDLGDESRDLNLTGHELLADVEQLQHLIDELLFLARQHGDDARPKKPVELDAIIDRVIAKDVPRDGVLIDSRDVRSLVVRGDEAQLTRLVENLLTNALRHCRRSVWFQTLVLDGNQALVVEDDGPGVPPADRERVFERFTRLDESRTVATGGAGLGLAIVAEIAEAHAATVHVEDGRTGGARFVVLFETAGEPEAQG